jgi:D-apiose dehydrogenase
MAGRGHQDKLIGVMIGAGYFAGFQAEAWGRIPGAQIAAVADPVPGRAEEFAARWRIPRAYTDPRSMLQAEQPDFVDIVTRPETHLELASLAAAQGCHVICQKPVAPTWEECLAMVRRCDEAGVRLLVHENWRWQPWYREIRRLLDHNVLGRPFHLGFHIRTGDGRGPEPYEVQPYFREMERFLVQETLVHFLDTARYLGGEIRTVFCRTARINPVIRGEDCALIQLDFEDGMQGVIDANRISGPLPPPLAFGTCTVEGELGSIRLSPDGRLWLTECGQDEVAHPFHTTDQGYKGDSVRACQEHLLSCLRSGLPAESEGREYLKTAAAVFACYQSAETGEAVVSGQWSVVSEALGVRA